MICIVCERIFMKLYLFSRNASTERLNWRSCNSISFSISPLISISSWVRVRISWSIGISIGISIADPLASYSCDYKAFFSFSLEMNFSFYPKHHWCFHILNCFSISSSSLDLCGLSLLQVAFGIKMLYFQYLIQSYETEHQFNQQHYLNYCSYFQWLGIKAISGCTSRKMLLQIDHSHFVCQNPALFYCLHVFVLFLLQLFLV